jgi:hypothetical protein
MGNISMGKAARQCPTLRYGQQLKIFFATEWSMPHPLNALCLDGAAGTWFWQAKNLFLTPLAQAALRGKAGQGRYQYGKAARQCPTRRGGKATADFAVAMVYPRGCGGLAQPFMFGWQVW